MLFIILRLFTFTLVVNPVKSFIANALVGAKSVLTLLRGIAFERKLHTLVDILDVNKKNSK